MQARYETIIFSTISYPYKRVYTLSIKRLKILGQYICNVRRWKSAHLLTFSNFWVKIVILPSSGQMTCGKKTGTFPSSHHYRCTEHWYIFKTFKKEWKVSYTHICAAHCLSIYRALTTYVIQSCLLVNSDEDCMNYGFMTNAEWKNFGYESPILHHECRSGAKRSVGTSGEDWRRVTKIFPFCMSHETIIHNPIQREKSFVVVTKLTRVF